jgi:hypothetical protein
MITAKLAQYSNIISDSSLGHAYYVILLGISRILHMETDKRR